MELLAVTVLAYRELLASTVPANRELLAGTVTANREFWAGLLRITVLYQIAVIFENIFIL